MIPDNDTPSLRIAERLAHFTADNETRQARMLEDAKVVASNNTHIAELEWMREQLGPVVVVETPAAEIAPSKECAAVILAWIERLGFENVSEGDAQTAFLGEFKPRTIKAALKHLVESDALKWWPENNLFRTPEGSRKRHAELEAVRQHVEEAAE